MAIPFDYTSEYKRKLRTPEEAARVVKSGDWLDISMGGAFPSLMDEAIAKQRQVAFTYNSYGTDKKLHPRRNGDGTVCCRLCSNPKRQKKEKYIYLNSLQF